VRPDKVVVDARVFEALEGVEKGVLFVARQESPGPSFARVRGTTTAADADAIVIVVSIVVDPVRVVVVHPVFSTGRGEKDASQCQQMTEREFHCDCKD
jgi:hypothetical protein